MKTRNSSRKIISARERRNSQVTAPDPILQKLNETFDRIDKSFDNVEIALGDLRREMTEGFDRLIRRLDELDDRVVRFLQKYGIRSAETSADRITRPE